MLNPIDIPAVIEKWYRALSFPEEYDSEFYKALQNYAIPPEIRIETYPYDTMGGKWDLLAFLYMCEQTEEKYRNKGICLKILLDTLSDIVLWCKEWSRIKGELFLGETGWLANHMSLQLFQIGRLQFCMETVPEEFAHYGMTPGEHYISVHIPAIGPLTVAECMKSFNMAREFFATYFPEVNYTYFSYNSWLLDDTLQAYLPPDSNILQFAKLFSPVAWKESDGLMRYIFGSDTTRENLPACQCSSVFAKKIKDALLADKVFYSVRGLLAK